MSVNGRDGELSGSLNGREGKCPGLKKVMGWELSGYA